MVDQAKKRLQALGFFKAVEVKRRPGSAPDRVVLDVELVEQSTGELSFGAGYSTAEGVIGDCQHHRAQPARQRPVPAPEAVRLARAPAGRPALHRAALPRPQPRGRLRPLPQGSRLQTSQSGFDRAARPAAALRLGFPLVREPVDADQLHALARRDLRRCEQRFAAIKQACGRSQA